MNLAVIPARGGSKRIPQKNIKPFLGKPVIAYSIDAARESNMFDRILVSTDTSEIAEVARAYGAEAPFLRPPELSDDHTPTIPVVRHSIQWIERNVSRVSKVCCIYATAAFIRPAYIREGQARLDECKADFAFSVTTFSFPIFRALRQDGQFVSMFWPEHELARSQDLPDAFHDAGQFYWGTRDAYFQYDGFFGPRSVPVFLPRHCVQDIDTPEDWARAEMMFRACEGSA